MGDVVHGLPVAVAIKRAQPDAEVTWVVDRPFAPIVERCPAVDSVVVREKGLGPWLRQAKGLGKFELALDLQGLAKSALVVAAVPCRRRLGYHWQREGSWIVSASVRPDPSSLHVVDQYLDVARAAGFEADRAEWGLEPTPEDVESANSLLKKAGWEGSPLAVMNAGAGWSTKRWDPQEFAGLSFRLREAGFAVAFIGSPAEREVWEAVSTHNPGRALDLIGKTSMGALVGLISLCRFHVGGDTGSSHIAAALGKPAWSIFTLTAPERSCPYGERKRCFDARASSVTAETVTERILAEES
ncbi:MAG: glycosyltransferase family 9 protein [Fimbriimonadaceae bacterium]